MLRVDRKTGQIPADFQDPYLELVHLLTEAAAIEQSLMLAYLYALFSIKDQYARVRGDLSESSFQEHSTGGRGGTAVLKRKDTFLDVALEEMQHLSLVNRYLADLGAAPNFTPHEFPYTADLYPFDIELRSMDEYVAATYLWIEADACALSLTSKCRKTGEPVDFIRNVRAVLKKGSKRYRETAIDEERLDHVGSLYHRIVEQTQIVAVKPPTFLPREFPWGDWEAKMNQVMFQGELSHYRFFRSVFTGEAFGSDGRIWKPGPGFPAQRFERRTAYTARPHSIRDDKARRVAWLSNLHYWIILTLLDLAYRSKGFTPLFSAAKLDYQYRAIDNMTMGLWVLGQHLANHYSLGVPFDAMGPQYGLGRSKDTSLQIVVRLINEAQRHAETLAKAKLLPKAFNMNLYTLTISGLSRSGASGGAAPHRESGPSGLSKESRRSADG
jgi:hypothetical protein